MTVKFWNVGCGDAITLNVKDNEGTNRNLFIDGGYLGTYKKTIKQELLAIQSAGQHVDLWIVTHTDRDHIGGVEAFLKDQTIVDKENLVAEYWFNWSSYTFMPLSKKISVTQGINLRDYLFDIGKLTSSDIVLSRIPIEWHGLKFIILSPDQERLTKSMIAWQEQESDKLIASGLNDYSETIATLLHQSFEEDLDVWNGGSIAFILEQNDKRILFLADSVPSVIIYALKLMGYSTTNKLQVDYVKLSHHGSKRNFDPTILELINCSKFIILANGITHALPNKWTLAQIVNSPNRTSSRIDFFFIGDNESLRSIFKVDNDIEQYNFTCHYNNAPFFSIELI